MNILIKAYKRQAWWWRLLVFVMCFNAGIGSWAATGKLAVGIPAFFFTFIFLSVIIYVIEKDA